MLKTRNVEGRKSEVLRQSDMFRRHRRYLECWKHETWNVGSRKSSEGCIRSAKCNRALGPCSGHSHQRSVDEHPVIVFIVVILISESQHTCSRYIRLMHLTLKTSNLVEKSNIETFHMISSVATRPRSDSKIFFSLARGEISLAFLA